MVFDECRLRFSYMGLGSYMKKLASYAGWQTFGGLGYIARHQFLTVVVNRFFGPKITASFSVGGTVSGEATALTGALNAAFAPAITTACGEGSIQRMQFMSYQASKFGTLLTLLFAIPMALEMDTILAIWLKDVPQWTNGICLIMLAVVVVEKLSLGHGLGLNASGKVARFQFCRGIACMTAVPFSIAGAFFFHHVYAVAIALLATTFIACCSDVWVAGKDIGLSVKYWIFRISIPIATVGTLTWAIGSLSCYSLSASFLRVLVTATITSMVIISCSWLFVLDSQEKVFIKHKLEQLFRRICNDRI